ncbi:MAG: ECF transporter S component [Spirochaetales bacterium]|nr:ECF transporter S component [Spirochaetales bacterium]
MENQTDKSKQNLAFRIAAIAVLTALTTVCTMIIRVPVTPTRGYINLADVAIFFTAMTFGPFTALAAGGLGTALADILGGYAQWAPITFFAHGVQGLVIGLIFKTSGTEEKGKMVMALVISFILGTLIMAGTYFVTGGLMYGFGAAATEIPGNILQNVAGVVLGFPLYLAVKKAYPPIAGYRW